MVAGTASAAMREECRGSRLYKCHWKENHLLNDMKPDTAEKRRERVYMVKNFPIFCKMKCSSFVWPIAFN
jgi:hypothetical protein